MRTTTYGRLLEALRAADARVLESQLNQAQQQDQVTGTMSFELRRPKKMDAEKALADHRLLLEALAAGDAPAAMAVMRGHLGRISDVIAVISAEHAGYVLRAPAEVEG